MSKFQKPVLFIVLFGCFVGWAFSFLLFVQKLNTEMSLNTYVRLAAHAKASESFCSGHPYYLQATNSAFSSELSVVGKSNGVPVKLFLSLSKFDVLFVKEYNQKTAELLVGR